MTDKQYGLIIPNKKKSTSKLQSRVLNPLVNSDDELEKDDNEDQQTFNWVEASLKKSAGNSGQKSLQKRLLREAFEEDKTVFQYDEVYDDIKASQEQELEKKRQLQQRKPKYIETILKHSEKRKLENERRLERKVQKEREAEGNEFADKESFVTPSYLKKLEELKKAEQEEKIEKLIEEKQDLHKHKNFGVFYNHLFKQRIKEEPTDPEDESRVNSNESTKQKKNYRTQKDLSDEEPSQNLNISTKIKEEPPSSDSSIEDERNSRERKYVSKRNEDQNGKRYNAKSREERSRSRSKSKGKEGATRQQAESRRERSRSKGRGDGDRDKGRSRKRISRSRSRSRDRGRRSYRKERSHSRSRSREERTFNRTRDKRERNNVEKSRERRSMDRSNEKYHVKERERNTRNRSKDRRDQRIDTNKRNRSKDRDGGGSDRIKDREKSTNRDKRLKREDKENRNGDIENVSGKPEIKSKQSINTRLGATDVNKMNFEDRIKRFMDIFAKRTVGQKFDEAVQRYFQRKAEREAYGGALTV